MTTASQSLRYWVDMTLECVRRDHTHTSASMLSVGDQRGPFLTARAVGLALGALHDAHAIADGRTPLLAMISVPPGLVGSNLEVAAAAACHEVLLLRYPKQARMLAPAWLHWVERYAGAGGGGAEASGRAFGMAVHAFGVMDPQHAQRDIYTPSGLPYTHAKPAHESTQTFAGGTWGNAPRFITTRVNLAPPPGRRSDIQVVDTPHYLEDFKLLVGKGVATRGASTRTLEEEIIGIYWGYDGPAELGTPPRLYLQVALAVLDAVEARRPKSLSTAEELAVLAAIAIGMADAGIDAWHYKYSPHHMMWRPVVGIQNATGTNGTTVPGWLPLGRPDTNGAGQTLTPDFPAYPSGHATFGATAFQLLRLFLVHKNLAKFEPDGRDNVRFDFTSDEYNGRNTDPRTMLPREHLTRAFDSLWKAIVENSVSRVFLGVHWQFDGITRKSADPDGLFGVPKAPSDLGKIGGVWLGAQLANQIAPRIGITAATIAASRM